MGRWADGWLGTSLGEVTRMDVLGKLREHAELEGDVVLFVEAPDGSTPLQVQGTLVTKDRNPNGRFMAAQFAVTGPGASAVPRTSPESDYIAGCGGDDLIRLCPGSADWERWEISDEYEAPVPMGKPCRGSEVEGEP